mmetsp:Transcript_6249/g.13787  ORF Transcript_6249/g.13787 Transcript_6249/m.13787 type:complete len:215 (+) Transcript_6249:397-1041(+)
MVQEVEAAALRVLVVFLAKGADLPKFGVVGATHDLEQQRLRRGDDQTLFLYMLGAVAHALQSHCSVVRPLRGDGVRHHVHLVATVQQLHGALQHAHVPLDAAQHHLPPARAAQRRSHLLREHGELLLLEDLRGRVQQDLRHCLPEGLGVLLRHDAGDVQSVHGGAEEGALADHRLGVVDEGAEALLHVADEEDGVGLHQSPQTRREEARHPDPY